MKILLIHTASTEGVVALADGSGVVQAEALPGRGSSEHLMPAVLRLFQRSGWPVRSLTVVVVVTGPGSFTGVRVGLSAAKGLCEACAVPLIALSRLALVASLSERPGEMVALLDAGRGEYYCGVYEKGERVLEELKRAEEVSGLILQRSAVTSEQRVWQSLQGLHGQEVRLVSEPGPEEMLRMALPRMLAGEWSDVAGTDANYLRRTDAEVLVGRAEI